MLLRKSGLGYSFDGFSQAARPLLVPTRRVGIVERVGNKSTRREPENANKIVTHRWRVDTFDLKKIGIGQGAVDEIFQESSFIFFLLLTVREEQKFLPRMGLQMFELGSIQVYETAGPPHHFYFVNQPAAPCLKTGAGALARPEPGTANAQIARLRPRSIPQPVDPAEPSVETAFHGVQNTPFHRAA